MKKSVLTLFIVIFSSALHAQTANFVWAKQMGGANSFNVSVVSGATDNLGNTYTTGNFGGTVDFDPSSALADTFNLTSAFNGDVFISKLNSSGNLVWAKQISGVTMFSQLSPSAVTTDDSGNVYVAGVFVDSVDFDPGSGTFYLNGFAAVYVVKLNAAGDFVWVVEQSGLGESGFSSMTVDAFQNLYLSISWYDSGTMLTYYIMSRYGSSGALFWSNALYASAMATDAGGNVYGTGPYKFDSSGTVQFTKQIGGTSTSIALDADGNIYSAGYFGGSADFNPSTASADTFNLTSAGSNDIFVSKLDSSGNFVWAKQMGGSGNDIAWHIALDAAGNVYTSGEFSGPADFDPSAGIIYNLNGTGGFISKLDASGNFVWATALTGTTNITAKSLGLDAPGNIYSAGNFQGTVNFDPGTGTFNLTSLGTSDIFVHKMSQFPCSPTSSTISPVACNSYTSPSGQFTVTNSGTYSDTIPNTQGCDSVITINLTVNTVNTSVLQNGTTLNAIATGTYQWIDCNNGNAIIPNEINQSFTATVNGSYAVIITQSGCSDTSACFTVTVGIDENDLTNSIKLFPNPCNGQCNIVSSENMEEMKVTNLCGQVIYQNKPDEKNISLQIDEPGIYFIQITTSRQTITKKIIVTK